jgi:hypothetical protein
MRRTLVLTAFLLVAAAALASAAAAKDMSVALASAAPGLDAGEPWQAELLVHGVPEMLAEATPSFTIRNTDSGETQTFAAKRLPGRTADGQLRYGAAVVFPSEGLWRYTVGDGITDREYEGGTVQVGTPAAAPAPTTSRPQPVAAADDGGFPAWPLAVGAIAAFALAALGAFAVKRRGPATA